MGANFILFLLGGALLLYSIRKKAIDIEGLIYTIAGVTNLRMDGVPAATLLIQISNPTNSDFPFFNTTISGHVIINGSVVLGNATAYLDQYLKSGSAIIVPVDFSVTNPVLTGGLVAVTSILSQSGTKLDFDGMLTISGISFPLTLNYSIS